MGALRFGARDNLSETRCCLSLGQLESLMGRFTVTNGSLFQGTGMGPPAQTVTSR